MLNSKVKTLGGFAVEVARGSCVATLMLCAGCIAFSVFGDHRCEVRNPKPDVRRTRLDPAGVDTPLPCSEFLDRWGLPDETQTTAGGDKLLTYKAGLRWNGFFFVFVVVPFGIGIPAGHATITLVVHY